MAKKQSPFKTVSEQLPFYPDMKDETENIHLPFIGCYISSQMLGDNPDPKEQIPVFTFVKLATGEKYFIVQSYAIKKAVDTAKAEHGTVNDIVFMFEFKEKTIVNGKPFNVFTTGYCTLEEYQIFSEVPAEGVEEVKAKAKPPKK